jgi:hypothetical protein
MKTTSRAGRVQLGTLIVSLGVAAAVVVAIDHRLEAKSAEVAQTAIHRQKEIVRQRTENGKLRDEADRLHAAPRVLSPDPGGAEVTAASVRKEALLVLAEMKKQGLIGVGSQIPTRGRGPAGAFTQESDGRLPAAFAQAFGLTAAEFDRLQTAVMTIRQRLGELALRGSVVRRDSADRIAIEVTLGPDGPVYRQQLQQAFAAALGPERLAAYETLSSGGMERVLRALGGRDRAITLTRGWESGMRTYSLNILEKDEEGRPPFPSGVGSSRFEGIRERLGVLAQLLPADFESSQ